MYIIKRDGREADFDITKITNAVFKAAQSVNGTDKHKAEEIAEKVKSAIPTDGLSGPIDVEAIQDLIEKTLIEEGHSRTAKAYILYRQQRTDKRNMKSVQHQVITKLLFSDAEENDDKRENANIDGDSAMGGMLKIGGTITRAYQLDHLEKPHHAEMHKNGVVHQHDLDFATACTNCLQIPLGAKLKSGFNTGLGSLRPPNSIGTAATHVCILIQASQNDFFGGQGIPTLDHDLAPYVAKTFISTCYDIFEATLLMDFEDTIYDLDPKKDILKPLYTHLMDEVPSMRLMNDAGYLTILEQFKKGTPEVVHAHLEAIWPKVIKLAIKRTDKQTLQAMESITHNLCTLNSRAGSQVPFSSVNFGTDTSAEGRMVIDNLLSAIENGLGNGEIPIFPISIFKMKKGISDEGSPNHDLFKKACAVSAKRLFPNFVNLDAPYNLQYYKEGRPETEVATMGCRTRVIGNTHDPENAITPGRGNIFPITLNLTYLALEAKESGLEGDDLIELFKDKVSDTMHEIFDMIDDRFEILCKRKAKNFPFAYGQHLVLGSEKLQPEDSIREVMKHGTLVTGFIGLAEALVALFGKHHGESEEMQKFGLDLISYMNNITIAKAQETGLNFSLMGSPAEGCCGRLLQLTRKRFGTLKGITDRAYLTNSFHVPVWYPISASRKVALEAPYHALCPAGHISYIELDGDPSDNLGAFESLINHMADSGMGYFSINHPVDRDPICGYVGIIKDVCPRCGRRAGEPVSAEKLLSLPTYKPDSKYRVHLEPKEGN